ncbi:hypothetical protein NPIL_482631 [Nephila pilipes]|uniref:Uncharacterized protein n=1 Tax=Nephila pilipes TaxID=299642 RepID=A0A8X6NS95_NEPPI|nr:hypothetical protein NPIL_482631 [Nephila pilipes]
MFVILASFSPYDKTSHRMDLIYLDCLSVVQTLPWLARPFTSGIHLLRWKGLLVFLVGEHWSDYLGEINLNAQGGRKAPTFKPHQHL